MVSMPLNLTNFPMLVDYFLTKLKFLSTSLCLSLNPKTPLKLSKTKERIPRKIVEYLDEEDQYGVDSSVPPRFDCENCPGKMVPIFYVGVYGKIYSYTEEK